MSGIGSKVSDTYYAVQHRPSGSGEWRGWAVYKSRKNAEDELAKITDRQARMIEIPGSELKNDDRHSDTPETDAALAKGMTAKETHEMLMRLERERDEAVQKYQKVLDDKIIELLVTADLSPRHGNGCQCAECVTAKRLNIFLEIKLGNQRAPLHEGG